MRFKQIFFMVATIAIFFSCKNRDKANTENPEQINGHAAWMSQGNMYEVNVRQYTPEGTFKAFEKHLDRLKEMGVQTLWFMPINPISVVDRKGAMGSYYAVKSFVDINPEYGTLEDWNNLVKHIHSLGMKVMIDWVPNHTGADHQWLTTHPDFYVVDSVTKKPLSPFDWTDVRKLNYANKALHDTMISQMKYWITTSDIDGFRCDVAGDVSDEFWKRCITELKSAKNIFMLAEADRKGLHEDGFDATYAWADFSMLKKIAKGERKANALDSVINKSDTMYPKNALRLYFTSNHDENSWNKADYGTMPGAIHAPFAVLTQTIKNTLPLIYSGQEEPVMDSISFFYKNAIGFKNYARADFYKTLLLLRKNNKAFAFDAAFKKIVVGDENAIYAYERTNGNSKVLVILNLSANAQNVQLTDKSLHTKAYNVFTKQEEELSDKGWSLQPWGYVVYEIK